MPVGRFSTFLQPTHNSPTTDPAGFPFWLESPGLARASTQALLSLYCTYVLRRDGERGICGGEIVTTQARALISVV
jgi:hypothetical protein